MQRDYRERLCQDDYRERLCQDDYRERLCQDDYRERLCQDDYEEYSRLKCDWMSLEINIFVKAIQVHIS